MFSSRAPIARCLAVVLVAIQGFLSAGCFGEKTMAPRVVSQTRTPAPAPDLPPPPVGLGVAGATPGVQADHTPGTMQPDAFSNEKFLELDGVIVDPAPAGEWTINAGATQVLITQLGPGRRGLGGPAFTNTYTMRPPPPARIYRTGFQTRIAVSTQVDNGRSYTGVGLKGGFDFQPLPPSVDVDVPNGGSASKNLSVTVKLEAGVQNAQAGTFYYITVGAYYGYGVTYRYRVVDGEQRALQAELDMIARSRADQRFRASISGSQGEDMNWDPYWELRWMDFNFSGGRRVRIFHITNRSNPTKRYTIFQDPDNNYYLTNWIQAF